jgi:hypothetical protein
VAAAEVLEHLQIRRGRVIRAAAAEVGLGDQAGDSARVGRDRLELRTVRRRIEGRVAKGEIAALVLRKRDEAHARVAVLVALAARDRLGEPLLAVKAIPRRDDEIARRVGCERGPEGFLDRLGAGRRPHDLFEPLAAPSRLQVRDEALHGVRLNPCNRVVGAERNRFEVAGAGRRVEPAHVAQELSLPLDRVVTEVGDEHARRVVVELAAVGGPVEDAGALRNRDLRGRVGAERDRLALVDHPPDGVRSVFA